MDQIVKLIDADKIGGWVRAGVAAVMGAGATSIGGWFVATPEWKTALGVVVSGIVVGAWSHLAKKYAAPAAA